VTLQIYLPIHKTKLTVCVSDILFMDSKDAINSSTTYTPYLEKLTRLKNDYRQIRYFTEIKHLELLMNHHWFPLANMIRFSSDLVWL